MKTLLKKAILPIIAMIAFASFASAQTLNTVITESIGDPPSISLYKYGTQGIVVNVANGFTDSNIGYRYQRPGYGAEYPGAIMGGGLCEYAFPNRSVILPLDTYQVKLYKRSGSGGAILWSITITLTDY